MCHLKVFQFFLQKMCHMTELHTFSHKVSHYYYYYTHICKHAMEFSK